MKKKHLHFLFCTCVVLIASSFCASTGAAQEVAEFVNPFIGTGGHGHTFPGASFPYGMVQLSPDTRNDNSWDGCSGYHYDDTLIFGFSHTHLSGTGCSDYGDVLFTPLQEKNQVTPNQYASPFSKQNETAVAGYYRVDLQKPEVRVELTSGERSGIQRYTWNKPGERFVLLDLKHRDVVLASSLVWKDSTTLSGYRISKAWAKNQSCYFETKLSKTIQSLTVYESGKIRHLKPGERIIGQDLVFVLEFKNNLDLLEIQTGISLCDEEGASLNRTTDAASFDDLFITCRKAWNDKLSCITLDEGTSREERFKFYTALYHVFLQPNLASDADGRYRGMNNTVYKPLQKTQKRYTVFSLWDTYRAAHPLLTIIDPQTVSALCKSMLDMYKEQGRLPVWELASNETDCMIGYHAVSVLLDAAAKGIDIGDKRLALEAMIKTATRPDPGLKAAEEQGFIGIEDDHESVSKTLEYGYNDWCIARFASMLNCSEDTIRRFYRRSLNYRNLYNPDNGFFQPRSNGSWLSGFDPAEVNNHFTEANSWQYSFYVPHDMDGLVALHGGKEKLNAKLDELFNASTETKGRVQADITGLIGQYAHGNEPSHHIPFLYAMLDQPQKTDQLVQQICRDFYLNTPNGLIGNEDCGQMSAWYVLACLGIYPVCPGSNEYITFKPRINNARIRLSDGLYHSIFPDNITGNGSNGNRIEHKAIVRSENHALEKVPVKNMYTGIPQTYSKNFVPAPISVSPAMSFKNEFPIRMEAGPEGTTLIQVPGTSEFIPLEPNATGRESGRYALKRIRGEHESGTVVFTKIARPDSMGLQSDARASMSYRLNGIESLNDGISGSAEWRKGNWYGVYGQDMQIDIDLLTSEPCDLEVGLLQDSKSWIFFPLKAEWFSSQDGLSYTSDCSMDLKDEQHEVAVVKKLVSGKTPSARYRRIILKGYGKLPDWHPGSGEESYIFIDEISKVKKK